MTGKGKLTSILKKRRINFKKLFDFGRINKLNLPLLSDIAKVCNELTTEYGSNLNPLIVACSFDNPNIVKILVEEGWSVNSFTEIGGTPLQVALAGGKIPVVQELIKLGADVKFMSREGYTPMWFALETNSGEKTCIDLIKLLLEAGVPVNSVIDKIEEKALHVAVHKNLPSVVSFLLQMGADGNSLNVEHETPLHYAAKLNRTQIIKLLAAHNVDLYKQNLFYFTPILMAVKHNFPEALKELVNSGCDVNKSNTVCFTPLQVAIFSLNLDMVKLLISLKADPNKKLDKGKTVFHVVVSLRQIYKVLGATLFKYKFDVCLDILEVLVERGGNVNVSDEFDVKPLQIAVQNGNIKLAKLFVRLGANVNAPLGKGTGPSLFHDVVKTNSDIIEQFLEYGADYSSVEKLTPYHFAIDIKINVKYLRGFVKYGCPYNLDKRFSTYLVAKSNKEIKEFFEAEELFFKGIQENSLDLVKSAVKCGAVPNGCSEQMKHPLHFVSQKGYKELVIFLLERSVPPNTLNNKGESSLFLAAKHGHFEICCVLLRFGACYDYCCKVCPKTPEMIAVEFKHKDIVDLFKDVSRMFRLARIKGSYIIEELEKQIENNIDSYLMFANATNSRGQTLLTTALHKGCNQNATDMLKLRIANSNL